MFRHTQTYFYFSASAWVFIFSLLAGGTLSVYFGKDLCWDLAYYHYLNPSVFFNPKMHVWLGLFLHQYINPTIDFLTYFLINYCSPRVVTFTLGALHGLNFWLLYLIAQLFLPKKLNISLALGLAMLGIYGPTAWPGIGSFQNDLLVSIFVLAMILLQLRALEDYKKTQHLNYKIIFLAYFFLGLGAGLKLTVCIFIVGALFAILSIKVLAIPRSEKPSKSNEIDIANTLRECNKPNKIVIVPPCCGRCNPVVKHSKSQLLLFLTTTHCKIILILISGTLLGLSIPAGHWMMRMWQAHHNPLFPFANDIFRITEFSFAGRDLRFLPKNVWQTLFYPFYFSWDGRTGDFFFRDVRFIFVYLLFVLLACKWCYQKLTNVQFLTKEQSSESNDISVRWLFAFFIFSYFTWQFYFSIARYLVTLEMLAPLIIFLLLKKICIDKSILIIFNIIIFYFIVELMQPLVKVRMPWYNTTYFNISLPSALKKSPHGTIVIAFPAIFYGVEPRPQFYLLPYFPKSWHFVGIPVYKDKYFFDKENDAALHAFIQKAPGPIFLLTSDFYLSKFYQIVMQFGLVESGGCEKIFSDRQYLTLQNVLLCPVKRFSAHATSAHS